MIRHRIRLRFRKVDDLRWIGHLDVVRTMERLFRRAELKLGMSEGFHPKPRMSFPSALAVGIAGLDEVVDVELAEERSADDVLAVLREQAPPGLEIASAEVLPAGAAKPQVVRVTLEMPVPPERRDVARERIAWLLAQPSYTVEREKGRKPVDLRSYVEDLSLDQDVVRMQIRVAREGSGRPREVLSAIGLEDLEQQGCYLTRTVVELAP